MYTTSRAIEKCFIIEVEEALTNLLEAALDRSDDRKPKMKTEVAMLMLKYTRGRRLS